MEQIEAAIAVVVRAHKILVCQRKADDTLGGYWEFPGGKCEAGETLEQCLARELHEELAIRATPTRRLTPIEHEYPGVRVRLHPFVCDFLDGELQLIECQDAQWVNAESLMQYRFPPANDSLLAEVISICGTVRSCPGDAGA